jgi:hypothetical protein
MPVLIRENDQDPYRLATYLETARRNPKQAAKEIAGVIVLGIALLAFCFLAGVM